MPLEKKLFLDNYVGDGLNIILGKEFYDPDKFNSYMIADHTRDLGDGKTIIDLGDGYFCPSEGIGERFLKSDDMKYLRGVFQGINPNGIGAIKLNKGKLTLRDVDGRKFDLTGDPDFDLYYYFPELEHSAGGTAYEPSNDILDRHPRLKKILTVLPIGLFIGAFVTNSGCINNGPTPTNEPNRNLGIYGRNADMSDDLIEILKQIPYTDAGVTFTQKLKESPYNIQYINIELATKDGIITDNDMDLLDDKDKDGIPESLDSNDNNPDKDLDHLLDGKNIKLNKSDELNKFFSKYKIFNEQISDNLIKFYGEEDIGIDPNKYSTDGDNKGDGFEKFISKTDPFIENKTYALLMFAKEETPEKNIRCFEDALKIYGIPSENIISFSHENATFENYKKATKELYLKTTENDDLLVFISGYGTKDSQFEFSDELIKNIQIIDEILKYNIKSRSIFISFNSCYSGTLIERLNKMKIDLPLVVYVSSPHNLPSGDFTYNFITNSGIGYNYTDREAFSFLDKNYYEKVKERDIKYIDNINGIYERFKLADVNNNGYVSLEEVFKVYCERKKELENDPRFNIELLSYDKNGLGKYLYFGDIYNPDVIRKSEK